jgi:hypothetical protein
MKGFYAVYAALLLMVSLAFTKGHPRSRAGEEAGLR